MILIKILHKVYDCCILSFSALTVITFSGEEIWAIHLERIQSFKKRAIKSVPPVDAFTLKTKARPIPINIPP